jgi:hypothetical protein
MAEPDLYIGKESVTFDFEGAPVYVGPTTVVRAGHPIMKGREDMFTPLVVHFEVAEKPALAKAKKTTE